MITIFVPTFNRPYFLLRLVEYYARLEFSGRIYIADSSTISNIEIAQEGLKTIGGSIEIQHEYFPNCTAEECTKLFLDSGKLVTPYMAVTGDDDFLVPNSIWESVNFLEKNPDYSAAHGVGIILTVDSDGPKGKIEAVSYKAQPVEEAPTAAERLEHHMANYSAGASAVRRVDTFQAMFRNIAGIHDTILRGEVVNTAISLIQGKEKQLDGLFLVRHFHSNVYPHNSAITYMTDPKWPATYENIVECLATELSYKDKISKSAAQEIVTRILWAFWRDQIIGVYPRHFGLDSMTVQRKGIWSTSMSFCMKVIASLKSRVSRLYPFCLSGNQISYEALTRKSHKFFDDFRQIRYSIEGK